MKAVASKVSVAESGGFYSPVYGCERKQRGEFINYSCRGLRNVYLKNGYTLHSASDGVFAKVESPLELERAVVLVLVESVCQLSAEAFRFLRSTVSMTRNELARLLGTKARDVLMWEYQVKEIPAAAELVVRALAKEQCSGFAELALIAGIIGRFEEHAEIEIRLEYADGYWTRVKD